MLIRSRAPLRIGLAGGGTDVSPYADLYGGAILNSTISLCAHATIEVLSESDDITFHAADKNEIVTYKRSEQLPIDGQLDLITGIYNRIAKDFKLKNKGFRLTTFVDAPPGSGLGSSSTLAVAIVGAFAEWLKLPFGEYDIAHLAYEIERVDLAMAGGRQDQYAATFGGFNFMEFYKDDKVIVNPLRIRSKHAYELENNLLIFYTQTSRLSSKIIEAQQKNVGDKQQQSIDAMHKLKEQALLMKEAVLKGDLNEVGPLLDYGWQHKKQMASGITNPLIDEIYDAALQAGATGGKISGAGGGGFMMFYCPRNTRYKVIDTLSDFGGAVHRYNFTNFGLKSYTLKK